MQVSCRHTYPWPSVSALPYQSSRTAACICAWTVITSWACYPAWTKIWFHYSRWLLNLRTLHHSCLKPFVMPFCLAEITPEFIHWFQHRFSTDGLSKNVPSQHPPMLGRKKWIQDVLLHNTTSWISGPNSGLGIDEDQWNNDALLISWRILLYENRSAIWLTTMAMNGNNRKEQWKQYVKDKWNVFSRARPNNLCNIRGPMNWQWNRWTGNATQRINNVLKNGTCCWAVGVTQELWGNSYRKRSAGCPCPSYLITSRKRAARLVNSSRHSCVLSHARNICSYYVSA